MVRRRLIRAKAEELLLRFNISKAPIPVEKFVTSLGAILTKSPSDDDKLSGFLVRDVGRGGTIIGVNKSHHRHRQRFSMAHEIGHWLLHPGQGVHVDDAGSMFRIDLRDQDSAKGTDLEEKEANLFAAELLMPQALIQAAVEDFVPLDEAAIAALAQRFDVSTQAMTFRLMYLRYVGI